MTCDVTDREDVVSTALSTPLTTCKGAVPRSVMVVTSKKSMLPVTYPYPFVVSVAGSCLLLLLIGQDFFPSVDAGQIRLHVRAPPGTRIEETENHFARVEEAIRAAHRWMRERDARAEPFLSGMFTRGEVVYAGSEAEAAHDREPVAIFTGEVLPLYAGDLDDDTVRILLNELASEIGRILEQEEVHVAYRDRTWTLKAVGEVALS